MPNSWFNSAETLEQQHIPPQTLSSCKSRRDEEEDILYHIYSFVNEDDKFLTLKQKNKQTCTSQI